MGGEEFNYKKIKKEYLKFLKSQEVLTEPFRDKIGQLNNFYLPISKKIFKNYKKNKNKNYRFDWRARIRKINYI